MRYVLWVLVCFWMVSSSYAVSAGEKFVTIGTADELGVYYPTGGAICRLVKRGTKDHGIRCFVESTDGSIFNLKGIRDRDLDLGIAQTDWVYNAYAGKEDFEKIGADTELRALFSLHVEALTVIVRKDSGIASFRDLRGKRVNIGTAGSGVRATMERLIKLEGWSRRSFAELKELKASKQGAALCAGEVDAVVYLAGHPNGAINEVANTCEITIVPVIGKEIDGLISENPYYYKATIPAGMYRGNPEPIATIGTKAILVTSSNLDAGIVYEIVKAVFDNLDNFKTLHPVFATLNPRNMATDGLVVPLHEGAARYYKEKNLIPQ